MCGTSPTEPHATGAQTHQPLGYAGALHERPLHQRKGPPEREPRPGASTSLQESQARNNVVRLRQWQRRDGEWIGSRSHSLTRRLLGPGGFCIKPMEIMRIQ